MDDQHADHRPIDSPAVDRRSTTAITCPSCGHELTMFHEDEPSAAERAAHAVADHVASWKFVAGIAAFLVVWIATNVLWRPFEPYPMVMIATTAAVLGTVAALQGPLILMSQRGAARRDRQRDRETLRVAANNERDLHLIAARLEDLGERLAIIERATVVSADGKDGRRRDGAV